MLLVCWIVSKHLLEEEVRTIFGGLKGPTIVDRLQCISIFISLTD